MKSNTIGSSTMKSVVTCFQGALAARIGCNKHRVHDVRALIVGRCRNCQNVCGHTSKALANKNFWPPNLMS